MPYTYNHDYMALYVGKLWFRRDPTVANALATDWNRAIDAGGYDTDNNR